MGLLRVSRPDHQPHMPTYIICIYLYIYIYVYIYSPVVYYSIRTSSLSEWSGFSSGQRGLCGFSYSLRLLTVEAVVRLDSGCPGHFRYALRWPKAK